MLINFTCLLPVLALFIIPVNAANEKQVRLIGGFNANEGAIQVNRNGVWKYLCDVTPYFLESLAGDLVCKELGYISAGISNVMIDQSIGYWKSNITCSPDDVSLMGCSNTGWLETETCETKLFTTIYCFKNVKFTNRYNRGSNGHVSVYNAILKEYQTVCQEGFTDATAQVFCKEFGYKSGRISSSSSIRNDTMMNTIYDCTGSESLLSDCPTVPASASCTNSYPVAQATCEGDLTITDKVSRMPIGYGVVKVYDDQGETMTLCADGFNENTAKVVCRDMGFGENGALFPSPSNLHDIRTAYKDTLKKSFNCVGTESRLRDCPSTTKQFCPNEIGASVLCQPDSNSTEDGVTRINNFNGPIEWGGVEVMYHGIWGSICVDRWDDNAAKVICGTTSTHAKAITRFMSFIDVTWIYDVNCTGKENNLKSCQFSTDGTKFNCSSDHQAIAYCYNDTFKYSLSGGGSNYGYVQVMKDGNTGYVIDSNGADPNNMAEAACNSLGFHGGLPYQMGETSATYWWDVSTNQQYPSFPRLQPENATTKTSPVQQKYLSVYCHGKVKLVGSYGSVLKKGDVVQYKYNKFYAICADGITKTEGDAVCRQLGFHQAVGVNERPFPSITPLGFHDFKCPKGANSTADCTSRFTGTGVGCTSGKAVVECGDGPTGGSNGRNIQVSVIFVMMCLVQIVLM
ncbi:scavenger receptor cysteine-rich type 1 protein M160 [Patella vulgata]|uniref:scavenger receptor cysteine-rich type 1 protein M160 n=1 Tax=Patella vulgata TaxID=6465 RepID=UPI00217F9EE9|nr:scavenger receptor cysteine-rich type 1 protein M160 [Patella vulgata]XP_050396440.1 scavenger receptor cysteine-rich type 1 protein M160 [Patella vulgata]